MIKLNDWLSINKTSGEGNDTITLNADKCETDNERNTSLTFKTRTTEILVNITQSTFTEAFTAIYNNLISSEWQGATKTIKVLTSHEDLTYTAPEWVTVTSERNGYINTYTVTFEPNTTNSRRFGSLNLKNWNGTFKPILLAQGIESEENKVIFYRGYTGSVEPYNSNGIIQHRKDEYVGTYGSVSSLLYDSSIIDVPENLFYNTVIESVSLPPSVKTIGKNAFYKAGLLGVDWCDGITTIGEKAFEDAFEAIPPYFVDNFPVLELPSSLKTIGKRAFALNSMFQTINFPTGLTTIGFGAFNNCNTILSITIPDSVTEIGDQAFFSCTSLNSITCNAIVAPTIYNNTFYTIPTNGVLEYPSGSDYSSWLRTDKYYLGYYGWTGVPI